MPSARNQKTTSPIVDFKNEQQGRKGALEARWGARLAQIAMTRKKHHLIEDVAVWRQQAANQDKHPPHARDRKSQQGVGGYVMVVVSFLRSYSRLKPPLTAQQAMFVIHVVDGVWTDQIRGIRLGLLATRMGLSNDAVSRIHRDLQKKLNQQGEPYLVSTRNRLDKDWTFDFAGLFDAIADYIHEQAEKLKQQAWDRAPEARVLKGTS